MIVLMRERERKGTLEQREASNEPTIRTSSTLFLASRKPTRDTYMDRRLHSFYVKDKPISARKPKGHFSLYDQGPIFESVRTFTVGIRVQVLATEDIHWSNRESE